ncbi:MAG: alpha/beta fold hydrolase [Phenylobacterium sp.]
MVTNRLDWLSGEVSVTGGRLAYHRTGGGGPPVILSHGLTDNGLCWTRLAEALASDFDVIMLDARGHGASSPPGEGGVAPDTPGQDLAEAITGLGLSGVIAIGHSMGARATAACAAAHPDLVRAVILEDPPFVPPMDSEAAAKRLARFKEQVKQLREMTDAELLALLRRQSPTWEAVEFPAWIESKRQVDRNALPILPTPWQDDIRRIKAPTLLIHGDAERGSMVGAAEAREARELNTELRALRVEGTGHNVRRENFPAYLLAVRSFLGEL